MSTDHHAHDHTDTGATGVGPGESCPTCNRRVPYPKKETSPDSRVKSLRIPADDSTFDEDFAIAMLIVGLTTQHKYAAHKFLRFVIDCIIRDEHEWAGLYLSEYAGTSPHSSDYRMPLDGHPQTQAAA